MLNPSAPTPVMKSTPTQDEKSANRLVDSEFRAAHGEPVCQDGPLPSEQADWLDFWEHCLLEDHLIAAPPQQ
jgi:hypothetical protein